MRGLFQAVGPLGLGFFSASEACARHTASRPGSEEPSCLSSGKVKLLALPASGHHSVRPGDGAQLITVAEATAAAEPLYGGSGRRDGPSLIRSQDSSPWVSVGCRRALLGEAWVTDKLPQTPARELLEASFRVTPTPPPSPAPEGTESPCPIWGAVPEVFPTFLGLRLRG